jgi:hypothetical protein
MFISYIFNKYIIVLEIPKNIIIEKEDKKEDNKDNIIKEEEVKKEEIIEKEIQKEEIKEEEIKKEIVLEKEIQKEEIKEDNKEENKDDEKKEEIKEEDKNKNNKKEEVIGRFFLSREIDYLWENKESLIWLFIWLILLRITIYFYEIKYWVLVEDNPFDNSKNPSQNKTIYYISAVIYNMEPIIKDWISEMKQLIDYLGTDRVIVSIVENGDSTDKTRKYLQFFENYLINHKVVNLINIEKREQKEGVDRIRFLAKLRNRSLDLLYKIGDLDFDNTKIIFFNDIIYRYEDILKLLFTNNGNYDTVCAMDYYEGFYDTWASIGLDGKQFRRYFPYFYNK